MAERSGAALREALAAKTLGFSSADQTEVVVAGSDTALTRFTHEACNQNVAANDLLVSVRTVIDGRTGVASTNQLDDRSLRDVVERSIALARVATSVPLVPKMASDAAPAAPAHAFDAATAGADAGRRGEMAGAIFREAEAAGYWSAGFVATSHKGITVTNSSGALASFDGTDAGVNVKMTAPDSSGFAEAYASGVGELDAASLGRAAVAKARTSAAPSDIDTGAWTVILEPPAFGELLAYLSDHFSALNFEEGSSFCSGGLDRTYFSDRVTIRDDYTHPLAPGMPFDFEGQPKQRVALVESGVVRNVVTDSYYAKKLGRANTGHALPAPNSEGPQPQNLVVDAGQKPVDQLIAETKRGLLVTRLWYTRTVDRKRAIVTGMTRDGTLLIEDGKIVRGVHNLRFNQSILEVLRRCEFSSELRRTASYSYALVCPYAKVEGFNFSSTTAF